jgi:hypothetical protein
METIAYGTRGYFDIEKSTDTNQNQVTTVKFHGKLVSATVTQMRDFVLLHARGGQYDPTYPGSASRHQTNASILLLAGAVIVPGFRALCVPDDSAEGLASAPA